MNRDARREDRVVLRLRPYQTFHSPPKHAQRASDVSEKLLHGLGDSLPWQGARRIRSEAMHLP